MGSIVAMDWLRANEDRGARRGHLGPPPIQPAVKVPVWKARAAKILTRLWPGLQMDNELDSQMIATDSGRHRRLRRRSARAPLGHPPLAHRVQRRPATASPLTPRATRPPLLATWGTPRIQSSAVPAWRPSLPSTARRSSSCRAPGLKHEVHNEPGNAAFTEEIGRWLLAHLDGGPTQG